MLDVGFVAYSAAVLVSGPEKERGTNALALGADLVGLVIPCATGLGMLVRGGRAVDHADDFVRLFRSVEPDELADIIRTGSYRALPWQNGKYFFPTRQQADDFAEMMTKRGIGGPYCTTSGCFPRALLDDPIPLAAEGPAHFIPTERLPEMRDVRIDGR